MGDEGTGRWNGGETGKEDGMLWIHGVEKGVNIILWSLWSLWVAEDAGGEAMPSSVKNAPAFSANHINQSTRIKTIVTKLTAVKGELKIIKLRRNSVKKGEPITNMLV